MNRSKNTPLVSIIMPVWNAGRFLDKAIRSLQDQSYDNWELIAVDDASSDDSCEKLRKAAKGDGRIKVLTNKSRMGPSAAANTAVKKASGRFIARMDADDVALPTRLREQVDFFLKTKDAVAVGGQCIVIDADGAFKGEKRFPTEPRDIKRMIFSNVPLQQPTLMVNRDLLPANFAWYESTLDVAEEVDLLFRLFEYGEIHNLSSFVLKYRIHSDNISLSNPKRTFLLTLQTRLRAVIKYGYRPTFKDLLTTLAQAGVVFLLPNRFIYPTYALFRGIGYSGVAKSRLKLASLQSA